MLSIFCITLTWLYHSLLYTMFFDIPLIWAYHHLSVFMYDLNMIILYIICSTSQDMVLNDHVNQTFETQS